MSATRGTEPAVRFDGVSGATRTSHSARSLLFTVLGEYLREPGAAMWTAGAIHVLGHLGVEERAARQALTRAARDGWIQAQRHGRRTLWRLTRRGAEHFVASAASVYDRRRHPADWDGTWIVLVTSVPEARRDLRHRLRTRLRWAGFGALGQGVWISPRAGSDSAAASVLTELGLTANAVSVLGQIGGQASEYEVVNRAWDLGALARDYATFVAEFDDRPVGGADRDAATVFTELTWMVHQWREFMLRDPALPGELLPVRWPGTVARELFYRRHDADHPVAVAWLAEHGVGPRIGDNVRQ